MEIIKNAISEAMTMKFEEEKNKETSNQTGSKKRFHYFHKE